ncbi:MAG: 4-hydroxythreonine-4-phosphate dehydrogenase PdxA [Paracoccaceae bacterium]|nr:4-hydroxythreonine-4-phosphate dehydrogenase PdxA [Paracoccaceae bacterium]
MRDTRPVAISCGEPAGIGPEIAVKAWAALGNDIPLLWIGDPDHLPPDTPVTELASAGARPAAGTVGVLALDLPGAAQAGQPRPEHAAGIIEAVTVGAALAASGEARALVTAPISKKALIDGAGFAFPGHTEFLADLAGCHRVVMMLAGPDLRVVPATIHIPLAEVPRRLNEELLIETVEITAAALIRDFGLAAPRIALSGLNPHAGEGGAMGDEEIRIIAPAVAALKARGLAVRGPLPADTMFHARARAGYDAAVCMYHDQALVPLKTIAFDDGVNVTLGLPFVRTSPDHGTAFDIAGRDIADPTSMIAAIRLAAEMTASRS